ncbi:prepilin peptidase [Sphingomonas sp. KRR8]|uniref:A24 family peptidase n=1 Tax=Sphingomonas sp. KRR8 TaxID=2942996 RepID=UPI002020A28E|nr:prepilin peptidase [Sphingomonas sp. KRR8]URD60886.1 prepilin peptidase [Sphingomonas sp. KRR8]
MNLLHIAPWWLAALLTLVLVAAAIQDIVARKISNLLVLAVLLLGLVAMVIAGIRPLLWQNWVIFAGLLVVGTVAYSRQIFGGGDIKLFAAVGLWSNLSAAPRLLVAILISGGVLALIMLAKLLVRREPGAGPLSSRRSVPYGVAIAAGALIVTWYGRRF